MNSLANLSGRLAGALVVVLALAALAIALLAPGFWLDNGLVYGGF